MVVLMSMFVCSSGIVDNSSRLVLAQLAVSAAFACLFLNRMLLASHYVSALLAGVALVLLDRHLLRRRSYAALRALPLAVRILNLLYTVHCTYSILL